MFQLSIFLGISSAFSSWYTHCQLCVPSRAHVNQNIVDIVIPRFLLFGPIELYCIWKNLFFFVAPNVSINLRNTQHKVCVTNLRRTHWTQIQKCPIVASSRFAHSWHHFVESLIRFGITQIRVCTIDDYVIWRKIRSRFHWINLLLIGKARFSAVAAAGAHCHCVNSHRTRKSKEIEMPMGTIPLFICAFKWSTFNWMWTYQNSNSNSAVLIYKFD